MGRIKRVTSYNCSQYFVMQPFLFLTTWRWWGTVPAWFVTLRFKFFLILFILYFKFKECGGALWVKFAFNDAWVIFCVRHCKNYVVSHLFSQPLSHQATVSHLELCVWEDPSSFWKIWACVFSKQSFRWSLKSSQLCTKNNNSILLNWECSLFYIFWSLWTIFSSSCLSFLLWCSFDYFENVILPPSCQCRSEVPDTDSNWGFFTESLFHYFMLFGTCVVLFLYL